MKNKIKFTMLRDNDGSIAKHISYNNGKLIKKSRATVNNGKVEHKEFTQNEFVGYLNTIPKNECLILGKLKHADSGQIVGSKKKQDLANGLFCRNLENFAWHNDYQLCCFDYDGGGNGDLTTDELITAITEIIPEFKDINKVIKYSSSANIKNKDGELLSKSNGFHVYFLVNHPERINEIFKGNNSWLSKKLWLGGHGWIKNSCPKDRRTVAVTQMLRTIVDHSVFSPERIIFEAAPQLADGLYKTDQDAGLLKETKDFLDLSYCQPLTDEEEQKYKMLVNHAKTENAKSSYMVKSKRMFKEHVKEKIENGSFKIRREFAGMSPAEIADKEHSLSSRRMLLLSHQLLLESGEKMTVQDILDDSKAYHGQCCHDPHEPDYGSSNIAMIFSDQDRPLIFSRAHGGITYHLRAEDVTYEPDFWSKDYWKEHFYLVAHNKKNEICHINGNRIDTYSQAGFYSRFNCFKVAVLPKDSTSVEYIKVTKWWLGNANKKCISDDRFEPSKPLVYEGDNGLLLNEYVPAILKKGLPIPTKNECAKAAKPQINHIKKLLHQPEDAEVLIDWFSYLIQVPNERPMFAPLVISSVRGVGKDMMTDIFSNMLGYAYCKKSTIENLSRTDAWGDTFYRSKLITVSECGSDKDRYTIGNTIKDSITSISMTMNLKGSKIVNEAVYCGMIFFSNHLSPFKLDEGDRRFFVTRCDWTKEEADKLKRSGYFRKLFGYYTDINNLNGLYHYLLNRSISTDLKGDAPMTPTKEIMMRSEPNEVEEFFNDLQNHPCRYWTKLMIDKLFDEIYGDDIHTENKQYRHYIGELLDVGKMKIDGKSYRIKTFTMKEAELDRSSIRQHINQHQGITTKTLDGEPASESGDNSNESEIIPDFLQ